MKEQEEKLIEFGIWLHETVFATYQSGGVYEGMWHVHFPEYGYITNEELIKNWEMYKEEQESLLDIINKEFDFNSLLDKYGGEGLYLIANRLIEIANEDVINSLNDSLN